MRKMGRLLSVLLVFVLITAFVTVPAEAVDQEYSFEGTVGETCYFIIYSNAYDEISSAKVYNGVVPGMDIDVAGGATLGLAGVPSTDGEFTVFITMTSKEMGTIDIKVTVTVNPILGVETEGTGEGSPVVTKHPTAETVVEGESATFIARADNTRQYFWQIAIADAVIDCSDIPSYVGNGVKVSGEFSDTLVISNIPKSMDGAAVWCQFIGAEESVTSKYAVLSVIPIEDAAPVVTKNPTDETVEEGGEAVFIARADYAQNYTWQLVAPDGVRYNCTEAAGKFSGLKVSGAETERVTLSNIPMELNGYRILCRFTAGYETVSEMAKITVTEKQEEKPAESPEPSPVQSQAPVTETVPSAAPEAAAPAVESAAPQAEEVRETVSRTEENAEKGGSNALLITAIISAAVVAVAGIAAYVVLKLKGQKPV